MSPAPCLGMEAISLSQWPSVGGRRKWREPLVLIQRSLRVWGIWGSEKGVWRERRGCTEGRKDLAPSVTPLCHRAAAPVPAFWPGHLRTREVFRPRQRSPCGLGLEGRGAGHLREGKGDSVTSPTTTRPGPLWSCLSLFSATLASQACDLSGPHLV